MAGTKPFDLLNRPLKRTNLIEASAGTGKTYTITGLFVRLVLEKQFSVDEILVVTFTEAATEALKDRIRKALRGAIRAFSEDGSEDVFLDRLVKKHRESEIALRLLREAVRAFDQAAICTIHGFCMRMLHDNAFESGSLFDTEFVTDQETVKKEVVDDFWRTHFYEASPLFVHYVLNSKVNPDALASLIGHTPGQPYLKIVPEVRVPDTSLQEEAFRRAFRAVQEAWPGAKGEVGEILTRGDSLSRRRYNPAKVSGWIQSMDETFGAGGLNLALFKDFEKFTAGEVSGAVKKGHAPPEHPFFHLCEVLKQRGDALEGVFEQRLLALKVALFHHVKESLARRKAEQNIQSFDDLLLRLREALKGSGGEKLAAAIRTKFKAVLVDEFQDTDPIQYAIFRRVFDHPECILFLIGDPKQAIYGFRGADVFAYMEASRTIRSRYTLGENWRSEPGLVTAVNALFTHAARPFLYDEIPFHPVVPAAGKDPCALTIDRKSEPPLQLWFVDAQKTTGTGQPVSKGRAREVLPLAVAREISRLLEQGRKQRAFLEEEPLGEGDIAVLVRTNSEARLAQEALSRLAIPSVLYSTGNLFDAHEALEMERVLAAVAEPNRQHLIRAALCTDMMGMKGEVLERLIENDAAWEERLIRFKSYHDLCKRQGFIQMLRFLLLTEQVLERLMSLPDGERRSTNLLHLAEVLHEESIRRKLGMTGLLKWLAEQRDAGTPGSEEHQLRLESDENAVRIVTVHRSKGLEYPVVFCPFLWDGSRLRNSKGPFTFHDERENRQPTLDLGSTRRDQNRVFAEKEQLAENLRLLYVALTRAKHRCYLVWGRFNGAESSAPAYLLHCPDAVRESDVVGAVEAAFVGLDDDDVLAGLKTLEATAEGAVRISGMPQGPGIAWTPYADERLKLSCRKFSAKIDHGWRISSFSSLVSGLHRAPEMADRDALVLVDQADARLPEGPGVDRQSPDIFSFPKGTKAGTFLHDVLEHLDFSQEDPAVVETLISDKLSEYGFEARWRQTVCDTVQKVLAVPLDPARKDFTLSRVIRADRLNELEFYFPLKSISPRTLANLFPKEIECPVTADFPEQIGRLDFSPLRGFMKGFIDMVFRFEDRYYLVDWKSNFLGGSVDDYNQEALAEVMKRDFYYLQYYIYTVAVNQYLKLRVNGYNYETHFGGVYYIFCRGIDPGRGPEFGVFTDRPPETAVQRLSEGLIMEEGANRE